MKNRTRIDEHNAKITAELRDKCNQIKHNKGCFYCPETEPVCLDFHHKDKQTKKQNISVMIGSHWSWDKIQTEMDKCIIVCSNCHRKLHAGISVLPFFPYPPSLALTNCQATEAGVLAG